MKAGNLEEAVMKASEKQNGTIAMSVRRVAWALGLVLACTALAEAADVVVRAVSERLQAALNAAQQDYGGTRPPGHAIVLTEERRKMQ